MRKYAFKRERESGKIINIRLHGTLITNSRIVEDENKEILSLPVKEYLWIRN